MVFFASRRPPSAAPPTPCQKSTCTGPPPIEWRALCMEFPEHSPGLEAQCEWRGFGQGASLKPTPLPRSLFALGSLKGLLLPVARYSLATLKPSCLLYLWQKLFNGLQNTCLSTSENTFNRHRGGKIIPSTCFCWNMWVGGVFQFLVIYLGSETQTTTIRKMKRSLPITFSPCPLHCWAFPLAGGWFAQKIVSLF